MRGLGRPRRELSVYEGAGKASGGRTCRRTDMKGTLGDERVLERAGGILYAHFRGDGWRE